jgi:uracil-DNA glycosylase family 4
VAYGTLLGDASIPKTQNTLTMSHSVRQLDYAWFKADLLSELKIAINEFQVAAVSGEARRQYDVVQVRTLAHRALGVLLSEFYRPHKIVPEHLRINLNERMLAIWFMDDGHTRIRPPRQPSSEIATVGFDDADLQVLLEGLKSLGLTAIALRGRIHFDIAATRELSRRIAPFVPPSMRYKLHPEVEAEIPYDLTRWTPGPTEVLYDEVEIEDITDRPRNDRTFFCIDVEGTHNFVTSGGVVHNCRPPGNRDPLPQEIDSCQDYLYRQLDLIEPKVVCTLGNFATKLLRGDMTGITRLHGRDELLQIGPRVVRLYPLFHPAAALYTPAMLATLREDFARIPELLARPAPEQPEPVAEPEPVVPEPELLEEEEVGLSAEQLGLF